MSGMDDTIHTQTVRASNAPPKTRRVLLEDRFLSLLAAIPPDKRGGIIHGHRIIFSDSSSDAIFHAMAHATKVTDPELVQKLSMYAFKGEIILQSLIAPDTELALCKNELERECVKHRLGELTTEIARNEKEKNSDQTAVLLHEFRELSEFLKRPA